MTVILEQEKVNIKNLKPKCIFVLTNVGMPRIFSNLLYVLFASFSKNVINHKTLQLSFQQKRKNKIAAGAKST